MLAESKLGHLDWKKTCQFCFNERSNPDDDNLGAQIVKVGLVNLLPDEEEKRIPFCSCKFVCILSVFPVKSTPSHLLSVTSLSCVSKNV